MSIYSHLLEETNISYTNESYIIQKLKKLFKDKIEDNKEKDEKSKVGYVATYKNYKVGSVEKLAGVEVKISIKESLESYIVIMSGERKDNKIRVKSNKFNKIIDEEITIYKLDIIEYNDLQEYKCKISNIVDKGKISDLINKYKIEYDVVNTEETKKYRSQLFKKLQIIAKNAINKAKNDGLSVLGFTVYSGKDEYGDEDEFFLGLQNYIDLVDCDAWEFTKNKARDDNEYDKYSKSFGVIYKYIDDEIKSQGIKGKLDYYGDWDSGPIVFEITDK